MSRVENKMLPSCTSPRRHKGWRRASKYLAIPALVALLPGLMVSARRQPVVLARQNESLFSRMERAVRVREPGWTLVSKDERGGATENKYFTQDWALGEDEYVSTATHEYGNEEAAAKTLAEFIKSPVSVPLKIEKVPGLGDEAYTMGGSPYRRKGGGTLVARRGNIMIRLDTSSLQAAKRFAEHMIAVVDAR